MIKLLFLMAFICLAASPNAHAGVVTKIVYEGENVELKVFVRRGFGTLIKFPEELTNAVLANKSLFSCQSFSKRVVCISQGNEGESSSLNVTTPRNDYILTLVSTDRSLYDGIAFVLSDTPQKQPGNKKTNDLFLKAFLKNFETKNLGYSDSAETLKLNVLKFIHLDDRFFFLFSVENTGDEPLNLSEIEVIVTVRADLTGLPVKSSKMRGIEFDFIKSRLAPKEKTEGAVSMRALNIKGNEEIALKLTAEGTRRHQACVNRIRL